MNEVILVEEFSMGSRFWKNLVRKIRTKNLSLEEVVKKYQGFEGNRNYFFSLTNDLGKTKEYIEHIIENNNVDRNGTRLICFQNNKSHEHIFKKEICFLGYDFGVCQEEKTVYSSIFNEILFGIIDELINFQFALNENLLFQEKEILNDYINLHHSLCLEGRDVEMDNDMDIYEIWKIDLKKEFKAI